MPKDAEEGMYPGKLSPLLIPRFYLGSFNTILDIEHHHKPARMKRRFPRKGGFCLYKRSN